MRRASRGLEKGLQGGLEKGDLEGGLKGSSKPEGFKEGLRKGQSFNFHPPKPLYAKEKVFKFRSPDRPLLSEKSCVRLLKSGRGSTIILFDRVRVT